MTTRNDTLAAITGFTPGPWEADYCPSEDRIGFYSIEALITHRHGPVADTMNRDYCISPEEDRANARLIASAPELLAELQNIANADPRNWNEEMRDQFQQWAQNRARAAIAKAEGK